MRILHKIGISISYYFQQEGNISMLWLSIIQTLRLISLYLLEHAKPVMNIFRLISLTIFGAWIFCIDISASLLMIWLTRDFCLVCMSNEFIKNGYFAVRLSILIELLVGAIYDVIMGEINKCDNLREKAIIVWVEWHCAVFYLVLPISLPLKTKRTIDL